jgi:small ligand-binding sensory domain FIST
MAVPSVLPNRYASALSTESDPLVAATEVCDQLLQAGMEQPDLAVLFVSHHDASQWDRLPEEVQQRLRPRNLIGCSAEGVVEKNREVEQQSALAIWAAVLPQSRITPLHLYFQRTIEGGAIVGWPDHLVGDWPKDAVLLLLAEPFSFPTDYLLQRMNEDQPGVRVLGGMASGATAPGQNRLFFGPSTLDSGAVGLMVDGGVTITSVVSQGCRPIGDPLIVTKAERNIIEQLGGRSALQQLKEIFQRLPTHEQELAQNGLHLGRTVSEYRDRFQAGDFLVRNVIGVDHESGAIAVGDFVRVGQTVQFHIRDEKSAHDDLVEQLSRRRTPQPAQAGLLFTCNGRGTRLFSQADHDARTVLEQCGPMPLAGFFAQGEIGPVQNMNFLHGFTASLVLFSETSPSHDG